MEFLKKLPDGTITSDNVQNYGEDAYLHTGLYTFIIGPAVNRRAVEARFSYMWRKVDGEWKIVHHHSSAVPRADSELEELEDMYPIAQASEMSSAWAVLLTRVTLITRVMYLRFSAVRLLC